MFAAGIRPLRGMRVARYFIIARSALLVGGQINTLMVLGHLPHNFLTMYASQLGPRWRWCCFRWRWPIASTR